MLTQGDKSNMTHYQEGSGVFIHQTCLSLVTYAVRSLWHLHPEDIVSPSYGFHLTATNVCMTCRTGCFCCRYNVNIYCYCGQSPLVKFKRVLRD